MARRSLEEVIQTIAPSRQRGIPDAPTIGVGFSSEGGDLATALSQAGQQIQQLQAVYQQQSNLITENTEALQSNTSSNATSSNSGRSGGSIPGAVASGLLGGGFGLLSPIISGIASWFGGSSAPAALPVYTPPPPVSISGVVQATPVTAQTSGNGSTSGASGGNQVGGAPQITVNVSAMDSQSFMDRSHDIASAVREAMLNMHPINNVVAEL
jgi:hypothetical protein